MRKASSSLLEEIAKKKININEHSSIEYFDFLGSSVADLNGVIDSLDQYPVNFDPEDIHNKVQSITRDFEKVFNHFKAISFPSTLLSSLEEIMLNLIDISLNLTRMKECSSHINAIKVPLCSLFEYTRQALDSGISLDSDFQGFCSVYEPVNEIITSLNSGELALDTVLALHGIKEPITKVMNVFISTEFANRAKPNITDEVLLEDKLSELNTVLQSLADDVLTSEPNLKKQVETLIHKTNQYQKNIQMKCKERGDLAAIRQLKSPIKQLLEELKEMKSKALESANLQELLSLKVPFCKLDEGLTIIEKASIADIPLIQSDLLSGLGNLVPRLEDILIEFVKINSLLEKSEIGSISEDIKASEELIQDLEKVSKLFQEPMKVLARAVVTTNSIQTDLDIFLVELPTTCENLKNILQSIDSLTSNPSIRHLNVTQEVGQLMIVLEEVIRNCNKERLDHKSLNNLKKAVANFKKSIQSLSKASDVLKDIDEDIVLNFNILLEPLNQIENNLKLAEEIGFNTRDISLEYLTNSTMWVTNYLDLVYS
ncbi:hypothetical protein JTB14_024374 [Gonioctena quinquepunctata]|nr:hypothetical protein JTB14_024374 [Gonioctena quinquepunctata]